MKNRQKGIALILVISLFLVACSNVKDTVEINNQNLNFYFEEYPLFDNDYLIDNIYSTNKSFYAITTSESGGNLNYEAIKIKELGDYSKLNYKKSINSGVHPIISSDSDGTPYVLETIDSECRIINLQNEKTVTIQNISEHIVDFKVDEKQNFYLFSNDRLIKFDTTGKKLGNIKFKGQYLDSCINYYGKTLIFSNSGTDTLISELNFEGNLLKPKYTIPAILNKFCLNTAKDKSVLAMGPGGIYDIVIDDKLSVSCMTSWDKYGYSLNKLALNVDNQGNICIILLRPGTGDETETAVARLSLSDEAEPRKEITLACFNQSAQLLKAVDSYNRKNQKAYIKIINYAPEQYDLLKAEVISGKGPDLFNVKGIPYQELCNAGVFEDLYTYIESDENLQLSELNHNIVSSLEFKGALYSIIPNYSIKTIIGNSKTANMIRQNEYYNNMFLSNITCRDILHILVCYDSSYLFNLENNEFNPDKYKEILEYCSKYPDTLSEASYREISDTDISLCGINDFYSIQFYEKIYGPAAEFIDFPSGNACIIPDIQIAISQNSKFKSECWDFLSFLLSKEYFNDSRKRYGFSIRNDALTEQAENAVSDLKSNLGGMSLDSIAVDYQPATREQINKILDLVKKPVNIPYYGKGTDITLSEAIPYFEKDVDLKTAVTRTESKLMIYLAEQFS